MPKKSVVNSVLNKIKSDHIKPKPRWEFLLKNYVFWLAFGLSIIIGAIAFSAIIFSCINNDWDVYRRTGESILSFTLKTFPIFWLITFSFFIFIADYNLRHTDKGYKYSLPIVAFSSLFISVVLGFALFGMGVAKSIDEHALRALPFYRMHTLKPRMEMWQHEENGLIGGEIIEINQKAITVETFKGKQSEISIVNIPPHMKKTFKEGMIVTIIGEFDSESGTFHALEIRPWKGNFMKMKESRLLLRII